MCQWKIVHFLNRYNVLHGRICLILCLPVEQSDPSYPVPVQSQLYEPTEFMQTPELEQELVPSVHSSLSESKIRNVSSLQIKGISIKYIFCSTPVFLFI